MPVIGFLDSGTRTDMNAIWRASIPASPRRYDAKLATGPRFFPAAERINFAEMFRDA
jgi:hypothetical protein